MDSTPEEPKPGSPRLVDLNRLANTPGYKLAINTPESPTEQASRLKLAELEAEHKLRTQRDEDTRKRVKDMSVHCFVMVVVAIAFLASVYIVVFKDTKTGLPDKAIGLITVIVSASVGYMTGKGSK